jgi:hypothetical protein
MTTGPAANWRYPSWYISSEGRFWSSERRRADCAPKIRNNVPVFVHRHRFGANFVAEDWDQLSTAEKLEELRAAVNTLERRQDDLLRYVTELADTVAVIELKLRQ